MDHVWVFVRAIPIEREAPHIRIHTRQKIPRRCLDIRQLKNQFSARAQKAFPFQQYEWVFPFKKVFKNVRRQQFIRALIGQRRLLNDLPVRVEPQRVQDFGRSRSVGIHNRVNVHVVGKNPSSGAIIDLHADFR